MRLLTSSEMQQVEQCASKFGLSYQRMMENAGSACARNIKAVLERENINGKKIVVVCGKGNNGGDGFVVARKFAENGYNVCVLLASGYPTSAEATYMYKSVLDLSVSTIWYDADKSKALQTVRNADIIVDAVFGFSFYGNINDDLKVLFNEINCAKGIRFSIDLPSGVYCNSGFYDSGCIKSDYTIAISALKPAHIVHPACEFCGNIIIVNIGLPEESYEYVGESIFTYDKSEIRELFPKRISTANKGNFGHLLCICGSKAMPGAAALATGAALRSGVGLVTVAFPECAYPIISSKLTEAILMPLKDNNFGTLSAECIGQLEKNIYKYDAVVIGCGLGVNDDTAEVVKWIIKNADVPVIIDADGINIISADIDIIRGAKNKLIFTPHPLEMSRLIGESVQSILSDTVATAKSFSDKYGVYVVLKNSNTVVAFPENSSVFINSTGNTGLSKGGSGDVLAGILGGFVAQHFDLASALCAGVYIHGYAADIVAADTSATGMLPSDVINELRTVFSSFEN